MLTTYLIIKIVLVCCAGFIAAIIDSIAGGGGLITVPALLAAGVPPHMALGTNKFCSTPAAFSSVLQFMKSKKTNMELLKYLVPFTLTGALLGSNSVLSIDENILRSLVLALILFVGLYTVFSKSIGAENKFSGLSGRNVAAGILLAFTLGFYDGFFGPGTGSLLLFGFIKVFGFDFVNAAGNAKVLNFTSNIAALAIFAFHGQIDFLIAFPMALSMILGARLGTVLAINKGPRLIKPIFVSMTLAAGAKIALQVLSGAYGKLIL
jgi:uncharacterized protein